MQPPEPTLLPREKCFNIKRTETRTLQPNYFCKRQAIDNIALLSYLILCELSLKSPLFVKKSMCRVGVSSFIDLQNQGERYKCEIKISCNLSCIFNNEFNSPPVDSATAVHMHSFVILFCVGLDSVSLEAAASIPTFLHFSGFSPQHLQCFSSLPGTARRSSAPVVLCVGSCLLN